MYSPADCFDKEWMNQIPDAAVCELSGPSGAGHSLFLFMGPEQSV